MITICVDSIGEYHHMFNKSLINLSEAMDWLTYIALYALFIFGLNLSR